MAATSLGDKTNGLSFHPLRLELMADILIWKRDARRCLFPLFPSSPGWHPQGLVDSPMVGGKPASPPVDVTVP